MQQERSDSPRRANWEVWISATALVVSIAVAVQSCETADKQGALDAAQSRLGTRVEERESAPILAAGVPPEERAERIAVSAAGERRTKYSHQPEIRKGRLDGKRVWALIVPVWNVGEGLAAVRYIKIVKDCHTPTLEHDRTAPLNPAYRRNRLGTYNVPPGASEQITWKVKHVRRARRAKKNKELSVFVRYTDLLVRRDRWTCMAWRGKHWSPVTQLSGDQAAKFAEPGEPLGPCPYRRCRDAAAATRERGRR